MGGTARALGFVMSRKSPRFIPPGSLVEITARTTAGRYLLTPSAAMNEAILASLGRALALHPVDLHAFAFMSNHWHGLVSVPDALALRGFVHSVHGNVARAAKRLHAWDGSVFGKPAYIVVGADAEVDRLRYVLSQGTKEGLVRRPTEWPGVHCARALLLDEVLVGVWRDRQRERCVRVGGGKGGGRAPAPGEIEIRYPIELTPLPSWCALTPKSRRTHVRKLLNEIEADARVAHPNALGAAVVLRQNPRHRPAAGKRSAASPIHTRDEDTRTMFTMQHIAYCEELHEAKRRLRHELPSVLPPACFPPSPPFRQERAAIWSTTRAMPVDVEERKKR